VNTWLEANKHLDEHHPWRRRLCGTGSC
jgi:hypothetical protein